MSSYLIKPCALAYLNQWYKTDKRIVQRISEANSTTQLANAIRSLAIDYQVVRNFPIKKIEEAHGKAEVEQRWRKVAQEVKKFRLDPEDHRGSIHELADRLGSIFHTDGHGKAKPTLISAATKFLWFSGRFEVQIYDKRAVDALNPMQKKRAQEEGRRGWLVGGDYGKYSQAWRQEYLAREFELSQAIKELSRRLEWSLIPEGKDRREILSELETEHFRERVFDKYLWTLGERKGGDGS
jgi:hypothetical protein